MRGRDAAKELTLKVNIVQVFTIDFRIDQVYRESQLVIGWTEQKSIEMDELAKEDHAYHLSTEDFKRYQGQWYLTLDKSGKNAPIRLRPDFRAAVSLKNRLHCESRQGVTEPISPAQYRRRHSSSSYSWWDTSDWSMAQVSACARHPIFMPSMMSGWAFVCCVCSSLCLFPCVSPSPCSSLPSSTCTLTWTPSSMLTTPRQSFPVSPPTEEILAAVIWDADDPGSVNSAYEPESSFAMSPQNTTRPLCFLVPCLQFGILQMADVHQWGKLNFSALNSCFIDHIVLVSDFRQLPRWYFLLFFPLFLHCRLCIWNC